MDLLHAAGGALAAKDGAIVPLIAETGGINAMLGDSSALPAGRTDRPYPRGAPADLFYVQGPLFWDDCGAQETADGSRPTRRGEVVSIATLAYDLLEWANIPVNLVCYLRENPFS